MESRGEANTMTLVWGEGTQKSSFLRAYHQGESEGR